MGNPSSIQWSIWICLAGITGVPFYFKNWLDRTKPVFAENVQNKTTRLSTLIFGLLFLGGFIFNRRHQGAAMILLFAAVISFSLLYQFAGRYQISMNRQKPEPLAAHGASIRKNATRLLVGAALCFLMSKINLLVLFLPFAIPFFMPLLVRLQHSCSPMAASPLKKEILQRFSEEGAPLSEIYLIDDRGSDSKNAFIAGSSLAAGAFGQTLFITLPLIRALNESEILAVALHEAAHAKRHHGPKRILASVGLMALSALWITVPLAFLLPGNLPLLGASIFATVFTQAFFLSKVIARQEHEADLIAVRMGASSNSLMEAIRKLSGPQKTSRSVIFRILSGNLYPAPDSRIEEILSCGASERTPVFHHKPAFLAYTLLVLGVVFWAANVRNTPANISRSGERIVSR
jgi:Zn-dependent protease with chaperone function